MRSLPSWPSLLRLGLALGLVAVFVETPAAAQTPSTTAPSHAPPHVDDGPLASPQRAVATFLRSARAARYRDAAHVLDVPEGADGAELARKLHAVLERYLVIDPEALSSSPEGDLEDGLPRNVEEVGRLTLPGDPTPEPIRLVRRTAAEGSRWRFTRRVSTSAADWYTTLDDRWIRERLPTTMLKTGPFGFLYWQWLALGLLVPLAFGVGSLLERLLRGAVAALARRTSTGVDDLLVGRLRTPFRVVLALVVFDFAVPFLGLTRTADLSIDRARRILIVVAATIGIVRAIHVFAEAAGRSEWAKANPASRSLVPIAARVADVTAIVCGLLMTLTILGYDVGAIVAGLGVSGVIVALAAQKTVENLLGAFSIGLDQPLREGDFVSIEGKLGTVEKVGLRSTRVRTLDRTLVTIPNGRLADMTIESFTARDRFRFHAVVGVVYGTTAEQVRSLKQGIEALLSSHPKVASDPITVRFRGFADSALELELMAWYATADFAEFTLVREELLLGILETVEKSGTEFAFPTRTVHLAKG